MQNGMLICHVVATAFTIPHHTTPVLSCEELKIMVYEKSGHQEKFKQT